MGDGSEINTSLMILLPEMHEEVYSYCGGSIERTGFPASASGELVVALRHPVGCVPRELAPRGALSYYQQPTVVG